MKFIFATNNHHKAEEIRHVLPPHFSILTLQEAGIHIDIPEPHDTLEANAGEKAARIYEMTGTDCFSEDSGLEVYGLGHEPGVRSARYAGEKAGSEENMDLLLLNLKPQLNRNARFRTVICLIMEGKKFFFEGICEGEIISQKRGLLGFGYDPIFVPRGSAKTFAQMTPEEKSSYSHRAKAVSGLVTFLNHLGLNPHN